MAMAVQRETRLYDGPGGPFEGVAAYDASLGVPRPGVLVFPNVLGQKEADNVKAEALAGLGYTALVADLYGQGKRTTRQSDRPTQYMDALNADRDLLRERLLASLAALRSLAQVDSARTAAIGFCFGGKCALDLARSGADVAGVVSFHGIYDPPPWEVASPIRAKVLVCHGWDDPLAPPAATVALAQELTEAGADWQLHAYGHTGHGFTDRTADNVARNIGYQPDADRRSWQATRDFLAELFG
jgi:dienelactone hydrolase